MTPNAPIRLVDPAGPIDAGVTSAFGEGRLLRFENFRKHYDAEPDQRWQIEVLDRLVGLLSMSPDWDGYGAPTVSRDAAMFALEILQRAMTRRTPVPKVVPSSVGGVQLEWHKKEIDLELHVISPYRCEIWFEDYQGGDLISKELSTDFSVFSLALDRLAKR